ncbi:hypothetical protein N7475_010486 [Penicillium sp. IBT 31633x]|nr:hypothetical protein N7475_010486 [Penicillium sp. IBT 31633x]
MSDPRPGPVTAFINERKALIFCLRAQSCALRRDPENAGAVAVVLRELVDTVYRLRAASMAMAVDARASPYVFAMPWGFYSYDVPRMCDDLVACLLHWADILVNTDGRRTDDIVVRSLESVLFTLNL